MDDEKARQAEKPLAGTKIVVTRARHQAERLAARFEQFGAAVILFPTIEIRPTDEAVRIEAPQAFDWIVFASANAIGMFRNRLESPRHHPPSSRYFVNQRFRKPMGSATYVENFADNEGF